ncbi:MAG: hypothetical protein KGS45_10355 [Planctomycetes bacterium]|nr:hypothetical protein [Planctomycetota bacterium]
MKKQLMAVAALGVCAGAAFGQVANPSFEDNGGGFSGWSTFEQAFVDTTIARTGTFAAKFFGNFSQQYAASGAYQDFPTTPGTTWTGTGWFAHTAGDPLVGQNIGLINIEWRRADGTLISYLTTTTVTSTSALDTWQQYTVSGVAPAETATARLVVLILQPNFEGGSVWVDDVAFSSQVNCSADFNNDGVVDFFDYLDFVAAFSSGC